MYIELDKSQLIGQGGSRDVYLHPLNDSQCIKIQRESSRVPSNQTEMFFLTLALPAIFIRNIMGK